MDQATRNLQIGLESQPVTERRNRRSLILAGILLVAAGYILLLVASALTRKPINDEGMFAIPAWTLATKGYLGSPVLDEAGWRFQNVNRYTYYMFPLYPTMLAFWYKLVGFGLFQLRAVSILSGLALGFALFSLLRRLGIEKAPAIAAVVLCLLDYHMLVGASFGRYDVLVAALGFGGYAAYLALRERSLSLALLLSNTLIAAAGMMHPNGLMFFIALWALLIIPRDWRRVFKPKQIAAAAAPYLFGAILWGAYIAQSPESFKTQLGGNSYSRVGILRPLAALQAELEQRYLPAFGFPQAHSAGHSGPIRLKVIPLVFYMIGLLGCLLIPALRNAKPVRQLLWLLLAHFAYLSLFEGIKFPYYLVQIIPLYASVLACFLYWCWESMRQPAARLVLAGSVALLLLVQVGGVLLRVRLDTYGKGYRPAAEYLIANAKPDEVINASCEMGFALGFRRNLIDDLRLGYFNGYKATYVVVDDVMEGTIEAWRNGSDLDRKIAAFITNKLANQYQPVYRHEYFTIYKLRPEAGPATRPEEWATAHRS
ncbi:MAG TPA: glycosyltransferase family 39 protein [Bryobacteraceae bacterium]|nr:glycosyltransferase family 39 protein [Bryobacteraceae bacterium]